MPPIYRTHSFIHPFPFAEAFRNARLDDLREEMQGERRDLIIDFHELHPTAPFTLVEQNEKPAERVQGEYIPRRVRFIDLAWIDREGVYNTLETVPREHDARSLRGMLHWSPAGQDPFYLLAQGAHGEAGLMFSARACVSEDRAGAVEPVDYIRGWSPPPVMHPGLVPDPPKLRRRFGGDPITFRLGKRIFHKRLFVGSLEEQHAKRPEVDAILNLGEEKSKWVTGHAETASEADRWAEKGEGLAGMSVEEIVAEAGWVIERLRQNQRVLVHCVAGFNRSVTIVAATLILLEGLSAEDAFVRLSEHHRWARPDPGHWLRLKWLHRFGPPP